MKIGLTALRSGYDTYERHRLVSALIQKSHSTRVLDVGGWPDLLAEFIPNPVFVTNLGAGDVIANGLSLPFADGTFDIVTSLDVLEHLVRESRADLINELFRVTRCSLVFCVPFGSDEHNQKEKEILDFLRRTGASNQMLEEHVSFVLPSLQEVQSYLPANSNAKLIYSGDFRFNNFLFRLDYGFGKGSVSRIIRFLLGSVFNIFGNLVVYPLCLSDNPRRFTNRVTVVLSKDGNGC